MPPARCNLRHRCRCCHHRCCRHHRPKRRMLLPYNTAQSAHTHNAPHSHQNHHQNPTITTSSSPCSSSSYPLRGPSLPLLCTYSSLTHVHCSLHTLLQPSACLFAAMQSPLLHVGPGPPSHAPRHSVDDDEKATDAALASSSFWLLVTTCDRAGESEKRVARPHIK